MAKQVVGTLEKVIESAKAEFLSMGFEKASMRSIAKAAGVTTGALYVRFPNKDALFCALVQPVVHEIFASFKQSENESIELLRAGKNSGVDETSQQYLSYLLGFIYDNIDAFRLLLNCAAGSSQDGFMDALVNAEVSISLEYLNEKAALGGTVPEISEQELHVLISAQFYAVFEIVRHDIPRETAVRHINTIVRFFNPGWREIYYA